MSKPEEVSAFPYGPTTAAAEASDGPLDSTLAAPAAVDAPEAIASATLIIRRKQTSGRDLRKATCGRQRVRTQARERPAR